MKCPARILWRPNDVCTQQTVRIAFLSILANTLPEAIFVKSSIFILQNVRK